MTPVLICENDVQKKATGSLYDIKSKLHEVKQETDIKSHFDLYFREKKRNYRQPDQV